MGVEVWVFLPTCTENVFIIYTPSAGYYHNIYVQMIMCTRLVGSVEICYIVIVLYVRCWALGQQSKV